MKTIRLTYTAFFIALGIILPQIFHLIGGPSIGAILLPMHIPVLIGAIILGPISGVVIGTVSVSMGFALGMPALLMAIFMFFELGVYGLVAGYLGYTRKFSPYIALICAMISGRLVSLALMQITIQLIKIKLPIIFGTLAVYSTGVPGILIQLIIIPVLVNTLRRNLYVDNRITAARTTK
ncbi:ECF transporter S component [Clostridiaceae bacterium M8S5]|nr:ECF transporter S component [Clostridiaceae bacterium M8S5]